MSGQLRLGAVIDINTASKAFQDVERYVNLAGVPTIVQVTTSAAVEADGEFLFVDCTGGAISLTLPTALDLPYASFTVKKIDATANAITLVGTVDGTVNLQILTPKVSLTIQSDGTNWYIV
jgi:hypothetical protein